MLGDRHTECSAASSGMRDLSLSYFLFSNEMLVSIGSIKYHRIIRVVHFTDILEDLGAIIKTTSHRECKAICTFHGWMTGASITLELKWTLTERIMCIVT